MVSEGMKFYLLREIPTEAFLLGRFRMLLETSVILPITWSIHHNADEY